MSLLVTGNTLAAGALALAMLPAWAGGRAGKRVRDRTEADATSGPAELWKDPADWATRDLFYGPGGKEHQPHGPFTFEKEDLDGTNPKFVVRDANGVKWKVKLGLEARPETVATRLAWAVGYYVSEDYFVSDTQIAGLPPHLHRGQKLIGPGGAVHNGRFKREPDKEKKIGAWQWNQDEFTGSREWNGLRTLMAVFDNWDLKDENNAVYRVGDERIFMVGDLGTGFGSAGRSYPRNRAKDNLDSYSRSRFVRKITPDTVDFETPARPRFVYLVDPKEYFARIRLERLGRNVPRADANWLGRLLARLSPTQIRDAFRAAGYSPDEVEGFSRRVEDRITVLTDL